MGQRRITKKGALSVTAHLDRLAVLMNQEWEALGIPQKIAKDMIHRCDLLSDRIEKRAGMVPQKVAQGEWFNPAEIGELEGGALESDADEDYTRDNFTQQEHHELKDRQESGDLENAVKMAQDLRKQADRLEAAAQGSKTPEHGFDLF